jgi:Methyltransferase small domain
MPLCHDMTIVREHSRRLREELNAHGFNESTVRKAMRSDSTTPLETAPLEIASEWVDSNASNDSFLHLLIRLFLIGTKERRNEFERGFSTHARRAAFESGLVRRADDHIVANVNLLPWQGFWFATDRYDRINDWDYVFRPNFSTASISWHMPQIGGRRTKRFVDVGTGCGCLAIIASKYFEERIALDINSRALLFASFNAAFNDIEIDCRPAIEVQNISNAQLRDVDLLMFNAPSSAASAFKAAALRWSADDSLAALYRALPLILSDDGRAIITHHAREEPEDALETWLRQLGCEAELEILWSHTALSPGWQRGVSFVRRRREGRAFFSAVPMRGVDAEAYFGRSMREVELQVITKQIVRKGMNSVRLAVPHIFSRVRVSRFSVVSDDRLKDADFLLADDLQQPLNAFEILKQIDGKRTVAEMIAHSIDQEASLTLVCGLAEGGIIWLE